MINPPHEVAGANQKQAAGDAFGTYYWTGSGQLATENLMEANSRVIMDRVVPFVEEAVAEQTPFFKAVIGRQEIGYFVDAQGMTPATGRGHRCLTARPSAVAASLGPHLNGAASGSTLKKSSAI